MSLDQQPAQTDYERDPRGKRRERFIVLAGVLVTVLAVAGIGVIVAGGADRTAPAVPGPAPVFPPSVAPSPAAPVVQTPEEQLVEEAKAAFVNFIRVGDEIAQGGFDNSERYAEVAIAPERTQLILEARRLADKRTTGNREVISMTPQSVELGGGEIRPKVQLLVCVDVSKTDGLDAAGRSVVPADRQTRYLEEVLLEKFAPGTSGAERGGFYVTTVKQLLDRPTC